MSRKLLVIMVAIFICCSCATTKLPQKVKQPIKITETKEAVIIPPKKLIPKTPAKKPESLRLLFPIRHGTISSPFGYRHGVFHRGVDIAAPVGTPIQACEAGIIVSIADLKYLRGYGKSVLIRHQAHIYTYYCHLHNIRVNKNQRVDKGEIIGVVGTTGNARGAHLHLELIMGKMNHNPLPYFIFDEYLLTRLSNWAKSIKWSVGLSRALHFLIYR